LQDQLVRADLLLSPGRDVCKVVAVAPGIAVQSNAPSDTCCFAGLGLLRRMMGDKQMLSFNTVQAICTSCIMPN
jgi:hypothetical protein